MSEAEWPAARSLRPFLAGALVGHYLLICSFQDWSAGHSYGPRYFTDVVPLLVFFLIPCCRGWWAAPRVRACCAACFARSPRQPLHSLRRRNQLGMHALEYQPDRDPLCPWRIWDWHDLQFLRGLAPPVRARLNAGKGRASGG